MTTATSGDYAQFRLLWVTREEPLPKDKFDEGWQAVEQIRIRALEPAFVELPSQTASDQLPAKEAPDALAAKESAREKVYLVLAEVRFDPQHPAARKEPARETVLMLVREQEQWRLAHAPKLMRDWIRAKAGAPQDEPKAVPVGNESGD